jgi:carboxypeptidase C (cathepsin A)
MTTGLALALAAVMTAGVTVADEPEAKEGDKKEGEKKEEKSEPPKPISSVTQHTATIAGAPLAYTATAGTLIVRNEKDEPYASMGYVAYARKDPGDLSRRPITFAYNGGPGSSSYWLHMGVLGPRRIVTTDAAATLPPPYTVVDNAHSILDKSDLVMIDPVGTGVSRAVGKAKDKDFWGTDPDIESVSRFIKEFVTQNDRWSSPKYLLGESYGTTRSAGIVDYLQGNENMAFNGVILVSVALDLGAIFDFPQNDRTFPMFLPTYAAVAWYHKALPTMPPALGPFLDEVRAYALGDYTKALMKGSGLPDAERAAVAQKLHEYTGLSLDYLQKADLRVTEGEFTQELLRGHRATVGRLDARFTGLTLDVLAKEADYDPQSEAISSAFAASFLDYYYRELKFPRDKTYNLSAPVYRDWDFKHKAPGSSFPIPGPPNTGPDLAHALTTNPNLRVLVMNGLYDLATPFLGTEYMISHLGIEKSLQANIEMTYYEAGHMMYVHPPSLESFRKDLAAFYDRGQRKN